MQNNWVGYIDRTYQQIKDKVITNLASLVPEVTDHTESNVFVKMLSIWSGIAEMLGYYIDNAAREAHLQTARLFRSAWFIAQSYGYRVKMYSSSYGFVTFKLDSPASSDIIIPQGTILKTSKDVKFVTTSDVTIQTGETYVDSDVMQYESLDNINAGQTNGSKSQIFVLHNQNIVDQSIEVKIDNIAWESVDNFSFSGNNSKHFVQTINEFKEVIIKFGDGITGKIPVSGKDIIVSYRVTTGENVGVGIIDEIETNLGINGLSVSNRERTTGASKGDSLEEIKRKLPLFLNTKERAVSADDFIFITELNNLVARAGVDDSECSSIDIYVVPNGGGIAPASVLSQISNYIDYRKVIGVKTRVFNAGEVHIALKIDLNINNNYIQTVVIDAVKMALKEFLSYKNQIIKSNVYISDLYSIIESTDGVLNSNIVSIVPVPYAKPLYNSSQLNWERSLVSGNAEESNYKIIMQSISVFEVRKNGNFLGFYNVGDLIELSDIHFKILNNYSIGNQWEFKTYKTFGNVFLREPSIAVSLDSDIIINANGGI